jgi:hypothetical protein
MVKRFSRRGANRLEANFQLVEMLYETASKKVSKLRKELSDLQDNRASIEREAQQSEHLPLAFYLQRKSLCDRDIARIETEIEVLLDEKLGFGVCFKRCYYLKYGKPTMSDLN